MVIVHPMKEIMCKRQWGGRQGQGISYGGIETGRATGAKEAAEEGSIYEQKARKAYLRG